MIMAWLLFRWIMEGDGHCYKETIIYDIAEEDIFFDVCVQTI